MYQALKGLLAEKKGRAEPREYRCYSKGILAPEPIRRALEVHRLSGYTRWPKDCTVQLNCPCGDRHRRESGWVRALQRHRCPSCHADAPKNWYKAFELSHPNLPKSANGNDGRFVCKGCGGHKYTASDFEPGFPDDEGDDGQEPDDAVDDGPPGGWRGRLTHEEQCLRFPEFLRKQKKYKAEKVREHLLADSFGHKHAERNRKDWRDFIAWLVRSGWEVESNKQRLPTVTRIKRWRSMAGRTGPEVASLVWEHQVDAKGKARCAHPGCRRLLVWSSSGTHHHHVEERAAPQRSGRRAGGTVGTCGPNEPWNIQALCQSHHDARHPSVKPRARPF